MVLIIAVIIIATILSFAALFAATMNRATMINKKPFYFSWNHENNSFSRTETYSLPEDAPSLKSTFFSDHPTEKWKTHSQQDSQQDVLILLLLKDKAKGFFVDLAANHYKARSNSYNVEQYDDWNGLCIEPNPVYLLGLLSHRKCLIFVNPVSEKLNERVKFRFHHDGLFGGIVGEDFDNKETANGNSSDISGGGGSASNSSISSNITAFHHRHSHLHHQQQQLQDEDSYLYTVTLEILLDFVEAPKMIDYLSLDVEGAEENVLRHFNFSKYNFSMLTIERPNLRLHNRLTDHGYLFVYTLKGGFGDCLYIHHTLEDVGSIMKKYHSPTRVPGWDHHHRPYLLIPPWNSSIYNTV